MEVEESISTSLKFYKVEDEVIFFFSLSLKRFFTGKYTGAPGCACKLYSKLFSNFKNDKK
jgi:hypothetical protein